MSPPGLHEFVCPIPKFEPVVSRAFCTGVAEAAPDGECGLANARRLIGIFHRPAPLDKREGFGQHA